MVSVLAEGAWGRAAGDGVHADAGLELGPRIRTLYKEIVKAGGKPEVG
jgi:hypothetical protein